MDRGKTPSERMASYFGVDVTDAAALRKVFGRESTGRPESWPGDSDIVISRALYDKYLRLFDLSLALADALDNVLDDAEHRLVMEEAQELGYRLPDFEGFHAELSEYRKFLGEHDPKDATPTADGRRVRIPAETTNMLQKLCDYNCYMVGHVFSGCFKTEYLKHFSTLKRSGFHYAGATALQETMNVLLAMIAIRREIDRDLGRDGPQGEPPRPHQP